MSVNCTYAVEAKLNGVNFTDITVDVIKDITFKYGIFGSSPLDRVGSPGEMKFTLSNTESNSGGLVGYYTPKHANCRAGFDVGLIIRLIVAYDGVTKVKFYGSIPSDGIQVQSGRLGSRNVNVTVNDWMYQATVHELVSPEFTQNKNIGEIVALILANMEKQPLSTDYETGDETFGSVFDTVKSTTRAMGEFAKVALSELGFIYITRSNYNHDVETNHEILRVEGRYTRSDLLKDLTVIIAGTTRSSPITTEADEYILTEDGLYYLVADEVYTPEFDNCQYQMSSPYGEYLYNRIKATAYPRIVDAASTTVLFSLSRYVEIAAGDTVLLTGRYRDPTGIYDRVAGTDMQAPVATTDYLMFQNSNGTGTNLTANLTVTPVYGVADVGYTLTNTGATKGYVTLLQARGKGIYIPDQVDYITEDSTSISNVGPSQLNLDMKYQDNALAISGIADVLLLQSKDAQMIPDKVSFYANREGYLMASFLVFEPGNRVKIIEDVTYTSNEFFIQGVEGVIKPGGLVSFSWYIRNAGYDTFDFAKWDVNNWDDSTLSKWAF